MKGSHVHVNVKDLSAAVQWFESICDRRPVFQNDRMAVISLECFSVILDAADEDTHATIAFDSEDCEGDFRKVVDRGAEVVEAPARKPWGVVAAYLKGPGGLTVEIEQLLKEEQST